MAKQTRNEFKAGVFVLAALAVLLGVVLWLGATDLFTDVRTRLIFYTPTRSGPLGLMEGTDVKVGDLVIGKIAEIRYVPCEKQDRCATSLPASRPSRVELEEVSFRKFDRVEYVVNVTSSDYTVYANAEARVAANFLGNSTLVITDLGTPDHPKADESQPILLTGGLDEVMQNVRRISENLLYELNAGNDDALLTRIKAMVEQLVSATGDISQMTETLKPELDPARSGTIAANIKTTTQHLAAGSETIRRYIDKDVGELLVEVRKVSTVVLETAENLRDSSETVREFLTGNRENLDAMVDDLGLVAANLKAASEEIRRNPWRLLHKPTETELKEVNLYDAARAFDSGATALNQAVSKLKALQQMQPETQNVQDAVERIRKHLLESFKEFKRVEDQLFRQVQEMK
jgi:ABC-type transporter Mla subunit MlaD